MIFITTQFFLLTNLLNQHSCRGGTFLAANSDKDLLKNFYGPVAGHVQIQILCLCYELCSGALLDGFQD